MASQIPLALRARIVKAYDSGDTSTYSLADRFQVSQKTVWRIIDRYKNDGLIDIMPHGGGRRKALGEMADKIVQGAVNKEPTATRQELANTIAKERGIRVSSTAIGRALARLGITRKKLTVRAEEGKRPEVQKKRRQHRKLQKKLDQKRLVFLDETAVSRLMGPVFGWAPSHSRAEGLRPVNRRETTTVIGAIRQTGIVAMRSLRGGMKKANFVAFVVNVLSCLLAPGDILVMDNLRSHYAAAAAVAVQRRGASILFLPPYSPHFNPIEMVWSTLKQRFRARFRRHTQSVGRAIGGAWRSLRGRDMTRLLEASGYRKVSHA